MSRYTTEKKVTEHIDALTGELIKSELTKTKKIKPRYFSMVFHDNVAMLNCVMNQEGMFFSHVLRRIDKDMKFIVNATVKREIIKEMGIQAKDPLNRAGVLLNGLVKKKLVARESSGCYMVNPDIIGNNADWDSINKKIHEFQRITMLFDGNSDGGNVKVESWSGDNE